MGGDRIEILKDVLLGLIRPTGQCPHILLHQARAVVGNVSWRDMQVASDELYREDRVSELPNFSRSIIRRLYRT